jgi:hypothetical protein
MMKSSRRRSVMMWIAASIFLIMSVPVSAQLPTATLLGVINDSSGAMVPGASVTARNTDTSQTRTTISGSDGSYRFDALPIGHYEVRAEHTGFETEVHTGLTLTVAQAAIVNFTLKVGATAQAVVVTSQASLVDVTSGSLGNLVSENQLVNLPLNGRNYINLALLEPGITQIINKGTGGPGMGTDFSSSGAPEYSNNILLDGARVQNWFSATSASVTGSALGLDGIEEFRVVTNSSSAEYGMTMGGEVLLVSKRGTNAFHGSAFEYLRNSALDARNYFDTPQGSGGHRLPEFRRNNFGGAFGGPIKKDKTFFFGVFEGLRQQQGTTNLISVPSAADKVNGGLVPVINPAIVPFLPYFPDPNLPNNEFTYPFTQPSTDNYGQMRVDQTLSAADTAFARYTVDDGAIVQPTSYPEFQISRASRGQALTLAEDHIFSPTLLNSLRFSFSRSSIGFESIDPGLIGPEFSFVPGQVAGDISIGGLSGGWGPSSATPAHDTQNIFTWSDDAYLTQGRHAFKFGVLINHYQQYSKFPTVSPRGSMSFPSLTSFLLGEPSSFVAATAGSTLQKDFSFNTVGLYVQDDVRVRSNFTLNLGLRYEFMTAFNETSNQAASLRDLQTDATTTIGTPFINPSLHNFGPRLGFAWDVMGDGKTAIRGGFGLLYDILANMGSIINNGICAPPFCSSSSVSNPPPLVTLPLSFPASSVGKSLNQLNYNLQQPHMLQYNLTVQRQLPWNMVATVSYAGSQGLNLLNVNEGNPTVPAGIPSVGATGAESCVPRPAGQVAPNIAQLSMVDGSANACWLGTETRINPNWSTIQLHSAQAESWYNALQFGLLKRFSNGLQFQSSYTWGKSIDTNPNQAADLTTSSVVPDDPFHLTSDRAPSNFDITQSWIFNAIYRIPDLARAGSLMGKLMGGWTTSGILTMQTGFPFTVELQAQRSLSMISGGGNPAGQGVSTDRPDLVAGRSNSNITSGTTEGCPGVAAGQQLGTASLWYDPCAFTLQPAGFLGSAGRNILRGPGLTNLDFSLKRDIPLRFLGEAGNLQFGVDAFNIFNNVNFATPALGGNSTNTTNGAGIIFAGSPKDTTETPLSTAGRITNTATTSRQIQLSLRIQF